ncbi:MAG: hypothetical protein KF777_06525 [Planctomycetaceae bacterium]|nr:hypothetical protein [Planctomycetaceae bacterium]
MLLYASAGGDGRDRNWYCKTFVLSGQKVRSPGPEAEFAVYRRLERALSLLD